MPVEAEKFGIIGWNKVKVNVLLHLGLKIVNEMKLLPVKIVLFHCFTLFAVVEFLQNLSKTVQYCQYSVTK